MYHSPLKNVRWSPKLFRRSFVLALLPLIAAMLSLGTNFKSEANSSPKLVALSAQADELWKDAPELFNQVATGEAPKAFRVLQLNQTLFDGTVKEAPLEFTAEARRTRTVLSLPVPDGRLWQFQIVESPVLSNELAKSFPQIRTFSGQSLDDPTATVRFSWTPKGLTAFVISEQGSFMVTPIGDDREHYVSYFTHDLQTKSFDCLTEPGADAFALQAESPADNLGVASGTLRRYRLAVSVTPEFIFNIGGEASAGQGTINAVTNYVNNVRAIYEREIGISFDLVAVWNPAFFGVNLGNGNLNQMDLQNQAFLDHLQYPGWFGPNSYDVGFALGFDPGIPSGLVKVLGGSCQLGMNAVGAAMVRGPSTNDYWGSVAMAHEFGHMFGAVHTFTPITSQDCAASADPMGLVEPGSGSTIMSYASVCGTDMLFTGEPHSAANSYFHIHSLLRIRDHKTFFSACGQTLTTGNSAPVIASAGSPATIPAFTPFTLTAAASDPNGDPITYAWEELDPATTLFRTFTPTSNPSRTFPSWIYILNNGNSPPLFVNGFFSGETLPSITRTLNFTVTVRDNRSSGGGTTARDQLLPVNVVGTAGPFRVTQPNTFVTLTGGSQTTVTWNVANTNLAPISTSAVRILLSTDGGATFPTVLADNTPNDGSQVVTLPNTPTNLARIKIEAAGNIYFDVSDTNFTIVAGSAAATMQFGSAIYSGNESSGAVNVTVNRTGNLANNASVDYSTSDLAGLQGCTLANGRASERCDYVTSVGTVQFAPGETSKTITIPVIDDVLLEGNETFTVSLKNATGGSVGTQGTTTATIVDNDVLIPTSNPIDGVEFFIRQQYLDILNRQPDPTGLQNWINTLAPCANGGFGEPPASDCDRLHVASGFFQSDEFLNRGYWAFRFYLVTQNQRPNYAQFIPDMAQVGGPKSTTEEQASKTAFADAFVQRPEFLARYAGLSGQPLANALLLTAGLPSNTFIVTGGMTNAQILRGVVETNAVFNKFLTQGFVSIQYFGFLRRDPDTIGYQNNLNTLNANPNNLRHMIFIFIYSTEYRSRFGPQ